MALSPFDSTMETLSIPFSRYRLPAGADHARGPQRTRGAAIVRNRIARVAGSLDVDSATDLYPM